MLEPHTAKDEKTQLTETISPPSEFYFLSKCSETTIQTLERKYQKSRVELENIIRAHKHLYYGYAGINNLSKLSNLLFTYTLIEFGNLAIDSCFEAIFGRPVGLNHYSYIITIPLALSDLILFSFIFSSSETAIKDTLQVAHLPTIKEYRNNPSTSWRKNLIEIAHFSACIIPIMTFGVPRILAIQGLIKNFSRPLRVVIQLPLLGIGLNFGLRYFSYSEYRKNCHLLLEKIKNYRAFKNTNAFISLQILLQYICLVGSTVYPLNYAQALLANKALGWWFPASLVSILTGWQLTIATLPNIIRVYTEDAEIVINNLKNNYREDISRLLIEKENKDTHENALKTIEEKYGKKAQIFLENYTNDVIDENNLTHFLKIYREDKLDIATTKNQSYFHIFKKDPILIFSSFLRIAVGMYTGYQLSQYQDKIPTVASTFLIGVPISGALFFTMQKAERSLRTAKDLIEEKNHADEKKMATTKEKILKGSIQVLNVNNVLITAMYVIATLAVLVENANSDTKNVGMIAILFVSLESALYMMRYNIEKVNETVKHIKETYRSPFRIFSKNKPSADEIVYPLTGQIQKNIC